MFDAPQYVQRWVAPGAADTDGVFLMVATEVLAGGNESALLAASDASASDKIVVATSTEFEQSAVASDYTVHVNLRSNLHPARAARLLDREVARIASAGPRPRELAAARARLKARLFTTIERFGFQTSRNEILGEGVMYANDAEAYRTLLQRYEAVTPAEVAAAARRWFVDRGFSLALIPASRPSVVAARDRPDRRATLSAPVTSTFHAPPVHQERIANGLRVLVSERPSVPLVRVTAVVRRDWHAADAPRDAMFALLATSSAAWSQQTIATFLDSLGTSMSRTVYADRVELGLSILPDALPRALALLRDLLARPTFEVQTRGDASGASDQRPVRRRVVTALGDGTANDVCESQPSGHSSCDLGRSEGLGGGSRAAAECRAAPRWQRVRDQRRRGVAAVRIVFHNDSRDQVTLNERLDQAEHSLRRPIRRFALEIGLPKRAIEELSRREFGDLDIGLHGSSDAFSSRSARDGWKSSPVRAGSARRAVRLSPSGVIGRPSHPGTHYLPNLRFRIESRTWRGASCPGRATR
jgi:hypothetical protein